MKWYLAKIVFRIICGDGNHKAQFDEQLRLVEAASREDAFSKAQNLGLTGEEKFYNAAQQIVQWKFINVAEILLLQPIADGAEIYARISEHDNADRYISLIHSQAKHTRESFAEPTFQVK